MNYNEKSNYRKRRLGGSLALPLPSVSPFGILFSALLQQGVGHFSHRIRINQSRTDLGILCHPKRHHSTGPSVAMRLFHNRRDTGQAATISLVTRFDRAMYSRWRSHTAPVSAGSWKRMLFS